MGWLPAQRPQRVGEDLVRLANAGDDAKDALVALLIMSCGELQNTMSDCVAQPRNAGMNKLVTTSH
jgi:hypothetical protein